MAFESKAIANCFLEMARVELQPLTLMKLQKLVYYAHGWHLALENAPLIDEQVEAWPYGPVIPSLYHEFKEFGNSPITRLATDMEWEWLADTMGDLKETTPLVPDDGSKEARFAKAIIKRIWKVYNKYTAVQLSNMTHESGSPWDQVNKEYGGHIPKRTDIPRESIRKYFLAQAEPRA